MGDQGNNLTDGEKKRIALARAIYLDRDIYFFDGFKPAGKLEK